MDCDILIIGGGISGLSSGALLANSGYSVIVLEKNTFTGGRAHVIEKDGFIVDCGLHITRFGKNSRCAEFLRRINKKLKFLKFGKPLVYYEKNFWEFPNDFSSFLKVFFTKQKFLSFESKLKFLKIFFSAIFTNPEKFRKSSLYDFLKRFSPTQEIIDIAGLFSGVAFICPDIKKVSAFEVGEFLKKALITKDHITYPEGGWKKIIDLAEREILKNGKILKNKEVKKIEIEKDEVIKVITLKEEFKAKAYISTVSFQDISKIIDLNKLSRNLQEYIKNLEGSSGISIDFALKRKVSNIDGMIMTVQPLSIGCFISNIEKNLAPEGKQLGNWFLYIHPEKITDGKCLKNEIKNFKGLLREMFPEISRNLIWEKIRIHKIVDGAVPKVGQAHYERPGFTSSIKNLFFANDATAGFGWGSEISFDSSLKCSEIVKKYLKNIV